jgi:hypothetical protein
MHVVHPQTSYAWNDGTAIAYQVLGTPGSGPDLLLVPGSVTHLEVLWQEPRVERFPDPPGFAFADAGEHELKGIPDHWRLYRVAAPDGPATGGS